MIYLPPPQPTLNKDIRISGEVEIHPTASLAPGVILQAAADSRIVIGADVCIGMGVIINSCQGTVKIGDGAILGAGVLIIGESKIGNNSCIGTSSTIFRQNVAAMAVVEPGSIIGDSSRPATSNEEHRKNDSIDSESKHDGNHKQTQPSKSSRKSPGFSSDDDVTQKSKQSQNSTSIPKVETTVEKQKAPVVGQVYINELLITLFPHKKASDSRLLE